MLNKYRPHVCGDEPSRVRLDRNTVRIGPTYVGMNREWDSTNSGTELSAPRMWG